MVLVVVMSKNICDQLYAFVKVDQNLHFYTIRSTKFVHMENLKCFAKVHFIWDPSQEMSSSTFHQNRPHRIGQQIKALFFGRIALELMSWLWSQKKPTLGNFDTSSTWLYNSFLFWFWILKNLLSADSEYPDPSLDDIITGRAPDHRN